MLAPSPAVRSSEPPRPNPPHQTLPCSATAPPCFFLSWPDTRETWTPNRGPAHPSTVRPLWAQGQTQKVDRLPHLLLLMSPWPRKPGKNCFSSFSEFPVFIFRK